MLSGAEEEKAESHEKDQHLHRLLHHLLCSLRNYKVNPSHARFTCSTCTHSGLPPHSSLVITGFLFHLIIIEDLMSFARSGDTRRQINLLTPSGVTIKTIILASVPPLWLVFLKTTKDDAFSVPPMECGFFFYSVFLHFFCFSLFPIRHVCRCCGLNNR